MFIVDQSGSNGTTDPSKSRRGDAIRNFFNKNSSNTGIEWGLITFQGSGATALLSAPYFQPASAFQSALGTFMSAQDTGGTPYKSAIYEATKGITEQLALDTEEMESNYEIIFLSDGVPTDYGSPIADGEIATDIERLVQLADGHIRFSTVYYNVGGAANDSAAFRLETMSTIGGGTYLDASNGGDINLDNILGGSFSKEPYIMKDFFIYNMNASLCDSGVIGADSDSDGLCDADEDHYNLLYGSVFSAYPEYAGKIFNKQNSHSFDEHFSDTFILRRLWGEALPACTAEEAATDSDNDLLNECEEKFLVNRNPTGPTLTWTSEMLVNPKYASKTNFDSDGDGLLDTLEFFFFKEKSAAMDYDNTKRLISNMSYYDLFKNHQSKVYPEKSKPYNIQVRQIERNDNGENCFTYQQEVLPTYPVAQVAAGAQPELFHRSNENVILVYYIMVPENNPNGKGVLRYSYQRVNSGLQDTQISLNLANDLFNEVRAK